MSQFLIESLEGEYLYYNKAVIGGGYYWKEKKEGATIFKRKMAMRVKRYLINDKGMRTVFLKPVPKAPSAHTK